MVGNNDGLIAGSLGCLHHFLHAFVYGLHRLFDSLVNTRMAHHVAIGKVHHDEVVLVLLDGSHQLVFHLVCTHLRFQVVCSHFRRRNQDTVFSFERSLAPTVEEERHVCIFLRLCRMQLRLALFAQVFTQRVLHVLFREEDVHALETGIVRCHTIVLQARYCHHALFRHVLLSKHHSQFLGTVVAVVEENHYIAFLDCTIHRRIIDSFHKLIGYTFVIRFLHGSHHVRSLLAFTFHQKVVSLFHTFPTLVAVHGIETADDGSNDAARLLALGLQLLDEALSALRVGVTPVHEAMHVSMLDAVSLGNAAQREQMVQRRVHATGRGQSHQMHALTVLLGIFVG